MRWLKNLLSQWLVEDESRERARADAGLHALGQEHNEALNRAEKRIDDLTALLHTAVQQLNHNSTVIHRWAHRSPMLAQIEAKHKAQERKIARAAAKRYTPPTRSSAVLDDCDDVVLPQHEVSDQ